MQKYKIVILDNAETIIRKNFYYIAETFENEAAAYAHIIDIYKKIQALSVFPKSHPIYEAYTGQEFRVARVRQYRIFYHVDDKRGIVYIADIMHAHQSPEDSSLPGTNIT